MKVELHEAWSFPILTRNNNYAPRSFLFIYKSLDTILWTPSRHCFDVARRSFSEIWPFQFLCFWVREAEKRLPTKTHAKLTRPGVLGGGRGLHTTPAPRALAGRGRGTPPREGRADAADRPAGARPAGAGGRGRGWGRGVGPPALRAYPRKLGPPALPRSAGRLHVRRRASAPSLPFLPSLPPSHPGLRLLLRPRPLPGAPCPAGR